MRHVRQFHKEKLSVCSYCNTGYLVLADHYRRNLTTQEMKCDKRDDGCAFTSRYKCQMKKHVLLDHMDDPAKFDQFRARFALNRE